MPVTAITVGGDEMARARGRPARFSTRPSARGASRYRRRSRRCASASITGPTSVADRPGIAEPSARPSRRTASRGNRFGDILLHVEAAQRRAALAGGLERRVHDVAHRLFGQRGASRRSSRSARRSRRSAARPGSRCSAMVRWIACAVSVEPVKETPSTRGVARSAPRRPWRRRRAAVAAPSRGTPASCSSATARARSAASARPAWPAPRCRRPARRRSGR